MRFRVLVVEVSMSEEGEKPRAPSRSPKLLLPLRAAFSCGEFTVLTALEGILVLHEIYQ